MGRVKDIYQSWPYKVWENYYTPHMHTNRFVIKFSLVFPGGIVLEKETMFFFLINDLIILLI